MDTMLDNIEKQIKNCQELLNVFRKEREVYATKTVVAMKEVNEIIAKKRQIMDIFESQQKIMKQLVVFQAQQGNQNKTKHKQLIRELATVLEQLLVIDQENEILLKELLTSRKKAIPQQQQNKRLRPALKPQMPFIPKSNSLPSSNSTNTPRQTPKVQKTEPASIPTSRIPAQSMTPHIQRPVIKSQLKNYFAAKQTVQLENSYV